MELAVHGPPDRVRPSWCHVRAADSPQPRGPRCHREASCPPRAPLLDTARDGRRRPSLDSSFGRDRMGADRLGHGDPHGGHRSAVQPSVAATPTAFRARATGSPDHILGRADRTRRRIGSGAPWRAVRGGGRHHQTVRRTPQHVLATAAAAVSDAPGWRSVLEEGVAVLAALVLQLRYRDHALVIVVLDLVEHAHDAVGRPATERLADVEL